MADKRKIVIDLNNSLYAHGFESEQQIHKEDLDKTISIIRNQLQQTDMQEDQNVFLTHLYRTIGIFGDRGSGKTSFMISLLNQCKNELKDDVEVLEHGYKGLPCKVKIAHFFDNMPELYAKSQLIISRSGASSVAEIAAVGIPSILVPLPITVSPLLLESA